jgi:hypothetical protein
MEWFGGGVTAIVVHGTFDLNGFQISTSLDGFNGGNYNSLHLVVTLPLLSLIITTLPEIGGQRPRDRVSLTLSQEGNGVKVLRPMAVVAETTIIPGEVGEQTCLTEVQEEKTVNPESLTVTDTIRVMEERL